MKFVKLTAAAFALALGATAAIAQTATTPVAPAAPKAPVVATTPAPTATAPAAAATTAKKSALKQAKTPEGAACSAEADAKNLHGKERKKFRAACMKAKAPAAAAKKN
jgi:psiF repeat